MVMTFALSCNLKEDEMSFEHKVNPPRKATVKLTVVFFIFLNIFYIPNCDNFFYIKQGALRKSKRPFKVFKCCAYPQVLTKART